MRLKDVIALEKESKEKEYRGETVGHYWSWILKNLIDCEYVEKFEETYRKIDWQKQEFGISLEVHLNIVLSYIATDDQAYVEHWYKKLNPYLDQLGIDNLSIELYELSIGTYKMGFKGPDNTLIALSSFTSNLADILRNARQKSRVSNEKGSERIKKVSSRIELLYEHLTALQNGFTIEGFEKINRLILPKDWRRINTGSEESGQFQNEYIKRMLTYEKKKIEQIFGGSKLSLT